jgi:hypothetical protein
MNKSGELAGAIRSPLRSFIRTVAVVCLVASILVVSLPGLLPGMRENGTVLNIGIDFHGRVRSVDDVSARGGLRIGDRVEPRSVGYGQWLHIVTGIPMAIGSRLPLTVDRDGRAVHLTIVADRVTGWPSYWVYLIKTCTQVVYLVVAGALVLLRPSRATWSFFALSFGYGEEIWQPWFWHSSMTSIPMLWWASLWKGVVLTPGALCVFAATFSSTIRGAFWRFVERAGIAFNIVLTAWDGGFFVAALAGSSTVFLFAYLRPWSIATLAGLALVVISYWSSGAEDRQRLKWVIFAFIASNCERIFVNLTQESARVWPTSWSAAGFPPDVLAALNVLVPLAVAYAVLRHRVLDITFVFSRALTYGIITSMIVAAFAVVDLILSKALEQRQIAIAAESVVAIAFGFGLNSIHRHVDAVLDRLLFRSRHLAEKAIERLAAGLPHVTSARAVDEAVVEEPARTMNLRSAAVFIQDEPGRFVRHAAIGWPDSSTTRFEGDDPLVISLQGEFETMRMHDVHRSHGVFPPGLDAPAIAVPMFVRHQLLGFALYGAHVSGEDIDPDERRLLERLTHSAAATYDHIDSESVRAQLREATMKLDQLTAASRA